MNAETEKVASYQNADAKKITAMTTQLSEFLDNGRIRDPEVQKALKALVFEARELYVNVAVNIAKEEMKNG